MERKHTFFSRSVSHVVFLGQLLCCLIIINLSIAAVRECPSLTSPTNGRVFVSSRSSRGITTYTLVPLATL